MFQCYSLFACFYTRVAYFVYLTFSLINGFFLFFVHYLIIVLYTCTYFISFLCISLSLLFLLSVYHLKKSLSLSKLSMHYHLLMLTLLIKAVFLLFPSPPLPSPASVSKPIFNLLRIILT